MCNVFSLLNFELFSIFSASFWNMWLSLKFTFFQNWPMTQIVFFCFIAEINVYLMLDIKISVVLCGWFSKFKVFCGFWIRVYFDTNEQKLHSSEHSNFKIPDFIVANFPKYVNCLLLIFELCDFFYDLLMKYTVTYSISTTKYDEFRFIPPGIHNLSEENVGIL